MEIRRMAEKGASISRISRELNISRPTILKTLKDEKPPKNHHPESREGRHTFIPKEKVPVDHPSEILKKERETTEIAGLRVEQAKSAKELEEVKGSEEHPVIAKKKIEVELVELGVREVEAEIKLDDLREKKLTRERVLEAEQRRIEGEKKIREMVNEVREQVLPFSMCGVIPAGIVFVIWKRIEEALSNIPNLSRSEAVLIAENTLTGCINDENLQPLIQDSLQRFGMEMAKTELNKGWKKFYEDYLGRGGKKSFRDFVLFFISGYSAEKQAQFLQVVDVW